MTASRARDSNKAVLLFCTPANHHPDPTERAKIVRVYFGQEPHARGNGFIYFLQRTITARLHGLVVKWEEVEG